MPSDSLERVRLKFSIHYAQTVFIQIAMRGGKKGTKKLKIYIQNSGYMAQAMGTR